MNQNLINKILLGVAFATSFLALLFSLNVFNSTEEPIVNEAEFRFVEGALEYRLGDGAWSALFDLDDLLKEVEDGVSVSNAQIVDGALVLTLNDGSTLTAGTVEGVGIDSASVNAQGELILTLTEGSTPLNLGVIRGLAGPQGVGISAVAINAEGQLIVTLTDGSAPINVGVVTGPLGETGVTGVSVTQAELNADNELILTFSDNTTQNVGVVRGPQGLPGTQGTQGLSASELYVQAYPGYTGSELDWLSDFILGTLPITVHFQYTSNGSNVIQTLQTFQGVLASSILSELDLDDANEVLPVHFLESGLYQLSVSSPISAMEFYSAKDFAFEVVVLGQDEHILLSVENEAGAFAADLYQPTASETREMFFGYGLSAPAHLQNLALHLTASAVLLGDIDLPTAVGPTDISTLNDTALASSISEVLDALNYTASDFSKLNLLPIGTQTNPFEGSLHGNSKSIKNLNIESTGSSNTLRIGIFGATENSSVENLVIDNAIVSNPFAVADSGSTALLIGEITSGNASSLNNITLSGLVTGGATNTAALVGYVSNVTLAASHINLVNSTINGVNRRLGGYFGFISNSNVNLLSNKIDNLSFALTGTSPEDAGGLIGQISASTLNINELNAQSINGTASNSFYVSGLIGRNFDTPTIIDNLTISGITLIAHNYVGSIIGYGLQTQLTLSGISATNIDLSGNEYLGGLIGNSFDTSANISDLNYDSLSISGTDYLGGLFGEIANSNFNIENTISSDINISGGGSLGGYVGEIKNSSTVEFLNTSLTNITINAIGNNLSLGGGFGNVLNSSLDVINSTINNINIAANDSYTVGGLAGFISISEFNALNVTANAINILAEGEIGGFVGGFGDFNSSTITTNVTLNAVTVTDVNLQGERWFGGLINFVNNSKLFINDLTLDNVEIDPSRGDSDDIGGVIGYISDSELEALNLKAINILINDKGIDGIGGFIGNSFNRNLITLSSIIVKSTVTVLGNQVGYDIGGFLGSVRDSSGSQLTLTADGLEIFFTYNGSGSSIGGFLGHEYSLLGTNLALDLIDVVLVLDINTTGDNVGGFIGSADVGLGNSSLYQLDTLNISGTINGHDNVGGLYGRTSTDMTATQSAVTLDLIITGNDKVGGLVGFVEGSSSSASPTAVFLSPGQIDLIVNASTNFSETVGQGLVNSNVDLESLVSSVEFNQLFKGDITAQSLMDAFNLDSINGLFVMDDINIDGLITLVKSGTINLDNFVLSGGALVVEGTSATAVTIKDGSLNATANPQTVGTTNVAIVLDSEGSLNLENIEVTLDSLDAIGVFVSQGSITVTNVTLSGMGTGVLMSGTAVYSITGTHFDVSGAGIVINGSTPDRTEIDALLSYNTFGPHVTDKVVVDGVVYNETLAEVSLEAILDGNATLSNYEAAGFSGVDSNNFQAFNDAINEHSLTDVTAIEELINLLNRINNNEATINDFYSLNTLYFGLKEEGITATSVPNETGFLGLQGVRDLLIASDNIQPSADGAANTINTALTEPDGNSVDVWWPSFKDNLTPNNELVYSLYYVTGTGTEFIFVVSGTSVDFNPFPSSLENSITIADLATSQLYTFKLEVTDLGGNTRVITATETTGPNAIVSLYASGLGTEEDPYIIETWEHLHNMRFNLDAYYKLNADLDKNSPGYETYNNTTTSVGWLPIGGAFIDNDNLTEIERQANIFKGTFNGNGRSISDLSIKDSEANKGLFHTLGMGSYVHNLVLNYEFFLTITSGALNGVGGLAANTISFVDDIVLIENITISGIINIESDGGTGFTSLGILIGNAYENIEVNNVFVEGIIKGDSSTQARDVGGLIGRVSIFRSKSTRENANATLTGITVNTFDFSSSSASNHNDNGIGGIVGQTDLYASGTSFNLENSSANVIISNSGLTPVGGLIGKGNRGVINISNSSTSGTITSSGMHIGKYIFRGNSVTSINQSNLSSTVSFTLPTYTIVFSPNTNNTNTEVLTFFPRFNVFENVRLFLANGESITNGDLDTIITIKETDDQSVTLLVTNATISGTTFKFNPSPVLTPGKSYTVEISGVQDAAGNVLPPITGTYTP